MASDSRTLTQRVGLLVGLAAFFVAFFAPTIPSLLAQVAEMLGKPAGHSDVIEVARGAQGTLALTFLMVI